MRRMGREGLTGACHVSTTALQDDINWSEGVGGIDKQGRGAGPLPLNRPAPAVRCTGAPPEARAKVPALPPLLRTAPPLLILCCSTPPQGPPLGPMLLAREGRRREATKKRWPLTMGMVSGSSREARRAAIAGSREARWGWEATADEASHRRAWWWWGGREWTGVWCSGAGGSFFPSYPPTCGTH